MQGTVDAGGARPACRTLSLSASAPPREIAISPPAPPREIVTVRVGWKERAPSCAAGRSGTAVLQLRLVADHDAHRMASDRWDCWVQKRDGWDSQAREHGMHISRRSNLHSTACCSGAVRVDHKRTTPAAARVADGSCGGRGAARTATMQVVSHDMPHDCAHHVIVTRRDVVICSVIGCTLLRSE